MRSRSRIVALVLLGALLLATGGVFIGGGGGRVDTPASTTTTSSVPEAVAEPAPDTDETFAIGERRDPYRISYRVEDLRGATPPSVDRVLVDPPFRSRLEIERADGLGTSLQIGTVDRLLFTTTTGGTVTIARVPGLAPAAISVGPIVEAGQDAGVVELGPQRIVDGRRCQVVRTATVLEAGPLRSLEGGDQVESCIDADGLLLEEVVYVAGEPVQSRTAFEVDLDPTVTDVYFATGEISAPPEQGGGATTPADPTSAPEGTFFALPDDAVPAGFELYGRFSVVPPQPERFRDPELQDSIIAGVADVFTSGPDVVVVYQGSSLGGVEPFEPVEFAQPVTSSVLGDGERLLSALGSELRFARPDGHFVHVYGTLTPAELLGVADALRPVEGSGLVLLDS